VGVLPYNARLACPTGEGVHQLGLSLDGGRPPAVEFTVPAENHLLVRIALPFKLGLVVPQFPEGIVELERKEITQAQLETMRHQMVEAKDGAPKRMTLPSHAGRILAAGFGAWLIGIAGFYALGRGMKDLQLMKLGEMSLKGKPAVVVGMVSGVLGFLVNVSFLAWRCSAGNV
jgi:hypothetical protein